MCGKQPKGGTATKANFLPPFLYISYPHQRKKEKRKKKSIQLLETKLHFNSKSSHSSTNSNELEFVSLFWLVNATCTFTAYLLAQFIFLPYLLIHQLINIGTNVELYKYIYVYWKMPTNRTNTSYVTSFRLISDVACSGYQTKFMVK